MIHKREKLIQRVLDSEKVLLEILYDRYASKAFHKCLTIVKNREVAQDLSMRIRLNDERDLVIPTNQLITKQIEIIRENKNLA